MLFHYSFYIDHQNENTRFNLHDQDVIRCKKMWKLYFVVDREAFFKGEAFFRPY